MFGLNYAPEPTGISPYTTGVARGLAAAGQRVRAIVSHPHYPEWVVAAGYGQWSKQELDGDVRILRLLHYVPSDPSPVRRAISETSFGLRQSLVRWGRPDAFVAVSPALLASALVRIRAFLTHRRVPFVLWVQDLYGVGLKETGHDVGFFSRIVEQIERALLRSATAVVVIHDRFAERVHLDHGVPLERIVVVRNWTHLPPLPAIDVAAVRASHGWAEDDVIVVHTGNMGVKQGLHHVVDAGRLARERGSRARFLLIGNGSQRESLQRRIETAPTTAEILEPLDDASFADVLQAADVLLVNELPGVSEMAVPSKLTSYFASGRPVLAATDAGGITAYEVQAAQAGICVPSGDPAAILDGALQLATDRPESARLGANGRRYSEEVLSKDSAVKLLDDLLQSLSAASSDASRGIKRK